MKKVFSCILLFISFLSILGSVVWGMVCVNDYNAIINNPASSGIDYLLIGMGYSIGFLGLSAVGFASSLAIKKLCVSKFFATASLTGIIIFALEFLYAITLFFM